MTYEQALAIPQERVRTMATNPSFARLRTHWHAAFGPKPPRAIDVERFWRRFVEDSRLESGAMRPGWLTGGDDQ